MNWRPNSEKKKRERRRTEERINEEKKRKKEKNGRPTSEKKKEESKVKSCGCGSLHVCLITKMPLSYELWKLKTAKMCFQFP